MTQGYMQVEANGTHGGYLNERYDDLASALKRAHELAGSPPRWSRVRVRWVGDDGTPYVGGVQYIWHATPARSVYGYGDKEEDWSKG